eukprot:364100-Chlamydomonas_euryale.AAC.58
MEAPFHQQPVISCREGALSPETSHQLQGVRLAPRNAETPSSDRQRPTPSPLKAPRQPGELWAPRTCNSTRRADGVPPGATDGVLPGTTGLTRAPSPPDWLSASAAQRRSSVAAVVGVWNRTRAATADSASDDSAAPRSPLRRSQVDLTSGRSERGLCGGASKA